MTSALSAQHPFRIFFVSALITVGSLIGVWNFLGPEATFLTFVLIIIEIMFSFDNAIINARVLSKMSRFWQLMFLTVGILIAVFVVRLVLPIIIVMLTTGLGAQPVIDLALNHPEQYAVQLELAHPLIASFGGMFLLMLCFAFFFDPGRKVRWINVIERPLQRMGKWWIYTTIAFTVLIIITLLPANDHPRDTMIAGTLGIILQLALSKLNDFFTHTQESSKLAKTSMFAGFTAFMYLQVLDASFSLDGVLGAFAVTTDIVLIAIGLGVGALWVRSFTLFMVRRNTLHAYRYLEHGAHYTIGVLALVLLAGLFFDIKEVWAGLAGITIITVAILNSIAETKADQRAHGRTA